MISSASLGYLKNRHFDLFSPPLPSKNVSAIESIDFGTIDKIMLEFEEPFWKHDNPGSDMSLNHIFQN
jgi:spermine oxidase